jgi:hypothetical protein
MTGGVTHPRASWSSPGLRTAEPLRRFRVSRIGNPRSLQKQLDKHERTKKLSSPRRPAELVVRAGGASVLQRSLSQGASLASVRQLSATRRDCTEADARVGHMRRYSASFPTSMRPHSALRTWRDPRPVISVCVRRLSTLESILKRTGVLRQPARADSVGGMSRKR